MSTAVDHRWWLCDAESMDQINEIEVHGRQMQLQLNSGGTIQGWMHLLDPKAKDMVEHQTAIRCDRNDEAIWSGPIYKINDTSSGGEGEQSGSDQRQFTALGWKQILNQRLIHTGAEFASMLTMPNGVAWQAQNGAYVPPGVDEATTLAYSATMFPSTTDAVIMMDLLDRANIDSPTLINHGAVYGTPLQRNLTLQRLQKVGDQINQLVNVEAGCDIVIDPVTRNMNLYGPGASPTPKITNGYGLDRGIGTRFTYPGNCTSANISGDGTVTANRMYGIGQYGVGRADDIQSQQMNGLFEDASSLSEVVDTNILIAYANVEVTVRRFPWTIITFTPRGITPKEADLGQFGVPRPFDDYGLGDIVYTVINRGAMQAGTLDTPQATRIFGFTLNIGDDGGEKLASVSTTYQGIGST